MMYLGTSPSYESVIAALDAHDIGLMCQPGSNRPRSGWIWSADNGCFADTWEERRWREWLDSGLPRSGCLFATVPDVVADHARTLDRWRRYSDYVRELHYPLAFAAQDGATVESIPWDELDTMFIGGTTGWKQGPTARGLAVEAQRLGKWVHIGRVNTASRLKSWQGIADSVDGTFLSFGPDTNLPRLLGWIERHNRHPQLFLPVRAAS